MRMVTSALKKFAQNARRQLLSEVEAQLGRVLKLDSTELRESAGAIESLKKQIHLTSREAVIDRVAYTWFNRLCALRFMDVNHYTELGIVSPAGDFTLPEILQEAKLGHVNVAFQPFLKMDRLEGVLNGSVPSSDAQQEAYRLLLVAVCNRYHPVMPFMFERIDDYTELLMPGDLLSESSVLSPLREVLSEETCRDVEVIGWLYQFYISEKKDEVFEGLKKNRKITPENIPAATQLFTPHWIVRYLVENSLGRLWMLNHADSRLVERMDYYIKPEEPERDYLQITSPEQIRICDPACGSGHMLTYAFDLLYAIYEEEGYPPGEIPENILAHNLYGIEIDERAGELAAFALTMKARARQRRFFQKGVKPNICVLENVRFDESELKSYMDFIGRDLFTAPLQTTLRQFEEADNFGSLIRPAIPNVQWMLKTLESKNVSENLFLSRTHQKVLQVLRQADYLSPKYYVVVANPPYMGGKGMNGRLAEWLKDNYSDVKFDLFSAFIVRNTELAMSRGQLGFMSPFVWMFISSYEKLRCFLINQKTITSLVQLEYSGFDGATVPICTFTLENACRPDFRGSYVRLTDFRGVENQGPRTLEAIKNPNCGWFYRASAADFKKIPGSPIAYWLSDRMREIFGQGTSLGEIASVVCGMTTGDNALFVRNWFEVAKNKCEFNIQSTEEGIESSKKWFPYNKGGDFRKWFGNNRHVLNWEDNGRDVIKYGKAFPRARQFYFRKSITWTFISSSKFGVRSSDPGFVFDMSGCSAFPENQLLINRVTAFLCTNIVFEYLRVMNPTLNFQVGNVSALPWLNDRIATFGDEIDTIANKAIRTSRSDWDSYETSWDFTCFPLLNSDYRSLTLKDTYQKLRTHWREMTLEMQCLEEENNRIFIEAYSLQGELTPEVPLNEITLTCNPHYRYGNGKSEEELEALLLADTMRELVSYSVGCMFGRYSLDKPGLILTNQGETVKDYLRQVPNPTFSPDEDNVIPILEGEWFSDDITERFKKFLKITFGEAHYPGNLAFIENAIGKDIRKFFLKDFYDDHVKRYKKRPIYWLFSSPNGGFNALIYMHRYRPDTVSVVLNGYLRDFRTKLKSRMEHLQLVEANPQTANKDKTAALKEMEKIRKLIKELDEYESKVLFPLATEKIEIDLDDGVKVNYAKFDKALRPIKGLENED